jgi:hypothetical protein
MRNIQMPELRFSPWYKWQDRDQYERAKYPGVYIIAITDKPDLVGKTPSYQEVVYIGMSGAKKGLASRWGQFDKAIRGIGENHSGGERIYKNRGKYDSWTEFLCVAAMGVECNTHQPTCEDYLKMGWVVFSEYEAFAEFCNSRPDDKHPLYNKK